MKNSPKYYTLAEAADEMRSSSKTLRRRIAEGKISYYKIGGKILVSPAEVDRYMKANLKPARR